MQRAAVHTQNRFEKITRWIGLYLLAPLLLILTLPALLQLASNPDYGFSAHRLTVRSVAPDGPAAQAGMQEGDAFLKIEGRLVTDSVEYYSALAGVRGLSRVTFTVVRRDEILDLPVRPVPPSPGRLIRGYSIWVTGLFFLAIGWWVLQRRTDLVARNFFALCMIFAFFLLDVPDLDRRWYMEGKDVVRSLMQYLLPAYFLRFFWQFPAPMRLRTGRPSRLRLLLAPGWTLFAFEMIFRESPPGSDAAHILELATLLYSLGFFLAGLALFTRRIFRRDRPIMHTKMLVILLGLLGGLVPFIVATVLGLTTNVALPQWQFLGFSLVLVPLSFGLAILRYGALDKAFVVRVSLIYGLLTLLVLAAYFALVVGAGQLLSRAFDVSTQPVLYLLFAATGLAILPLRRLAQTSIDRTFYPSRLANRAAMQSLADELTGLIEASEVMRVIASRLNQLYRPETFALYLEDGEDPPRYRPWGKDADEEDNRPARPLRADSSLAVLLDRLRRPVYVEEVEDLLLALDADAASLRLLTRSRAMLLVPLVTGNRLLGFAAFGPKTTGDLYSQEDLARLHSLMIQSASVIESRMLYAESLERRIVDKELELARDVQTRLLPDGPLVTPEFSIAGLNQPCRHVGGDYFDYFLRRDGCLGFAIADVAGKGVPAALQMTSLRSAFRNLAETADSPAAVAVRLSTALAESGSAGQFVCFFFGLWNPSTRLLTYCNAGMDPPVLFRTDSGFRQHLKKGGPVLGVHPEFAYREGTLALQPRDRIFLYTDGLTEEMDEEGEFFLAERLEDLVAANLGLAADRLLRTIFDRINEFGNGRKSDDRTAILLEVKV